MASLTQWQGRRVCNEGRGEHVLDEVGVVIFSYCTYKYVYIVLVVFFKVQSTRNPTFRRRYLMMFFQNRGQADRVEVDFRASRTDQESKGATGTRPRSNLIVEGDGGWNGSRPLEIVLRLLRVHPDMLMQARSRLELWEG